MKNLLLLAVCCLFAFTASAQDKSKRIPYDWEAAKYFTDQTNKPLKTTIDNENIYYDPADNQYLTGENFKKKYGVKTIQKFDNLSYLNILQTIQKKENKLSRRISRPNQTAEQTNVSYRWRLNPVNTVVGGSMIGVSLATVLICNVQDIDPNTAEIINYAGAGVALVGTIVLISGLHKEYVPGKGLAVSNNLYLDSPAGLSLAIAF